MTVFISSSYPMKLCRIKSMSNTKFIIFFNLHMLAVMCQKHMKHETCHTTEISLFLLLLTFMLIFVDVKVIRLSVSRSSGTCPPKVSVCKCRVNYDLNHLRCSQFIRQLAIDKCWGNVSYLTLSVNSPSKIGTTVSVFKLFVCLFAMRSF